MPALTLKVLASVLQMHGPDATIQSDHQGIDALLGNIRPRITAEELIERPTEVAFRRGFVRGPVFRRGFGRR
jgi:hypothetical protein